MAVAEFAKAVAPFRPEKARLAATAQIAEMHRGEVQEMLARRFADKMSGLRKRFAAAAIFWDAGVQAEAELSTLEGLHSGLTALAEDAPRRLAEAAAEAGDAMRIALEYGEMAATCAAEYGKAIKQGGSKLGKHTRKLRETEKEQFVGTANQMLATDCADILGFAEGGEWERRWQRVLKQEGATGGGAAAGGGELAQAAEGGDESGVLGRFSGWPATRNWDLGGAAEDLGDFADPRRGIAALMGCLRAFAAMCLQRSELRRQLREGDVKPARKTKGAAREKSALPAELLMPPGGREAIRQLRDAALQPTGGRKTGRSGGSERKVYDELAGVVARALPLRSGDKVAEALVERVREADAETDGAMIALAERILSRGIAGVVAGEIAAAGERLTYPTP